jgi:hypothetical protein
MKPGQHKLAPGTILTEDEYREYLRSLSVHRASLEQRQITSKARRYGHDPVDAYTGLSIRTMESIWDEVWMQHFLSKPMKEERAHDPGVEKHLSRLELTGTDIAEEQRHRWAHGSLQLTTE